MLSPFSIRISRIVFSPFVFCDPIAPPYQKFRLKLYLSSQTTLIYTTSSPIKMHSQKFLILVKILNIFFGFVKCFCRKWPGDEDNRVGGGFAAPTSHTTGHACSAPRRFPSVCNICHLDDKLTRPSSSNHCTFIAK